MEVSGDHLHASESWTLNWHRDAAVSCAVNFIPCWIVKSNILIVCLGANEQNKQQLTALVNSKGLSTHPRTQLCLWELPVYSHTSSLTRACCASHIPKALHEPFNILHRMVFCFPVNTTLLSWELWEEFSHRVVNNWSSSPLKKKKSWCLLDMALQTHYSTRKHHAETSSRSTTPLSSTR